MALAIIMVLYASIGVLAAAGSMAISRRLFAGSRERVFYGLFLVLIAAFYLAFTAHFDGGRAWLAETGAVVAFGLLGLLGCARTGLLAAGYLLHGLWDLLHEVPLSGGPPLTEIPLAYGVFCAAFDWCVAAYCIRRRRDWQHAGS